MKLRLICLMVAAACAGSLSAAAATAPQPAPPAATQPAPAAKVNGREVSREEFERVLAQVMREKFYHRAPPEGQLEAVRRDVLEGLVKRSLILAEAERDSITVDEAAVQEAIDHYETRYSGSEMWKNNRSNVIPPLRRELGEQQQLKRLEARVRTLAEPSAEEARAFHGANPAMFTEPERVHVSVILLKVAASASKAERDKVREQGKVLHEKLARGANFAELARAQSGDESASKGGDLGYVHRGMLPEALHASLDALKAGELALPVDVLEGVAVFKLHERTPPKLRDFDAVAARAAQMLKRERADAKWIDFVAQLRHKAVVVVDKTLYLGANAAMEKSSWTVPAKSAAD